MRENIRAEIRRVTQALYSEKVPFKKLPKFTFFNREKSKLVTYIAAKVASRLDAPLARQQVDEAVVDFQSSVASLPDKVLFDKILTTQKDIAELLWMKATLRILNGKLKHKNDDTSFEAAVYFLENARKGPIPQQEKDEWYARSMKLRMKVAEVERLELEDLAKTNFSLYVNVTGQKELSRLDNMADEAELESRYAQVDDAVEQQEHRLQQLLSEATA